MQKEIPAYFGAAGFAAGAGWGCAGGGGATFTFCSSFMGSFNELSSQWAMESEVRFPRASMRLRSSAAGPQELRAMIAKTTNGKIDLFIMASD
jgi:hypothetical protein